MPEVKLPVSRDLIMQGQKVAQVINCDFTTADWRWVTVLAVKKNNSAVNAYDLLMTAGHFNDAADKELLAPDIIVASGNFKSSLLDQWSVFKPHKVSTSRRSTISIPTHNGHPGGDVAARIGTAVGLEIPLLSPPPTVGTTFVKPTIN